VKSKFGSLSLVLLFAGIVFSSTSAAAQANAYRQTNLTSDIMGSATNFTPGLKNPSGVAFFPGGSFFVANNGSGTVTVHDASGSSIGLVGFAVPNSTGTAGAPLTGIVADLTGNFALPADGVLTQFIVASQDGTVSAWGPDSQGDIPQQALRTIDNSAAGAVYTGIAILRPTSSNPYLLVANFHSGFAEPYIEFSPLAPPGDFQDPNLPNGYAPFGIQTIGDQVFITFALQDAAKQNPVPGLGNGIVDIFDMEGSFVRRFATNGPLNAPWGVTEASANFGAYSNAILIGNFGDGVVNAFDNASGDFLGALKDGAGNVISNPGLRTLTFRNDGVGDPNTLFFTAGLVPENHGLLGAVSVSNGAPDFSMTASPPAVALALGDSMSIALSAAPLNGFNESVTFSCVAFTGISCSIKPPSVTGGAPATLTLTNSGVASQQRSVLATLTSVVLFTPWGTLGALLWTRGRRRAGNRSLLSAVAGILTICLISISLVACGGHGSQPDSGNRGTASILVTARSASVTHTTTVSITLR
jgi:uncharacterized protein (TIGR03118 family)